MLNFSNLILLLLLLLPNQLLARECDSLKLVFLKNNTYQDIDIIDLKNGIDSGDMCIKNLMGVMLYNGIYFDKNSERAEEIFADLSDKNYPESQFNFALSMTRKLDQDPSVVTGLILGIYYKYADDRKNSNLSSLAKKLGSKYTENLPELINGCALNKNTCGKKLSSLNLEDAQLIARTFEESIRDAQFKVATDRLKLSHDTKNQADNIFGLLSIGLAVSQLSYSLNQTRSYARCDYFSCKPGLSVGDLYNFGMLK